jgi:hypothetical protein
VPVDHDDLVDPGRQGGEDMGRFRSSLRVGTTMLTVGGAARVEGCEGSAGRSRTDTAEARCDNLVLQSLVETGGGNALVRWAASNKPFRSGP